MRSISLFSKIISFFVVFLGISLLCTRSAATARDVQPISLSSAWLVKPIGQFGGSVGPIAVQANYAYIGQGSRLVIVDISDSAHPILAGKSESFSTLVSHVEVSGNYAYVSTRSETMIFDISIPTVPVLLSSYNKSGHFALSGQKLLITALDGLYILDISIPAKPILLGSYPLSSGIGCAVAGNNVYVLNEVWEGERQDVLYVVDFSDPAHPQKIGEFSGFAMNQFVSEIALSGKHAFVAAYDGLYLLDISDPAQPKKITIYSTGYSLKAVAVSGSYIYTGDFYHIYVLSIDDAGYIRPLGELPIFNTPEEIVEYDGHLFVSGPGPRSVYPPLFAGGMAILDVSQPALPQLISIYEGLIPDHLRITNNKAYFVSPGKLKVYDISNPAAPAEAGEYPFPDKVNDLEINGNYAYLTSGKYLKILDMSSLPLIQLSGVYTSTYLAHGVEISGTLAYLAESGFGLRILDIDDPSHPTAMGEWQEFHGYTLPYLDVSGNYVVLSGSTSYIYVVNINDPSNPTLAGYYDSQVYSGITKIAIKGANIYYVTDGPASLKILDATNLNMITQVGSFPLAPVPSCLTLSGNETYICNNMTAWGGLRILNVANAAQPIQNLLYQTPGTQYGIVVDGDMIYVNDGENGLLMLQILTRHAFQVSLPLLRR